MFLHPRASRPDETAAIVFLTLGPRQREHGLGPRGGGRAGPDEHLRSMPRHPYPTPYFAKAQNTPCILKGQMRTS